MKKILNFIDGTFTQPKTGKFLESFNPALGEPHLLVADSGAEDVADAVQSAQRVFPEWAGLEPGERSLYLFRIAELVEKRREQFAEAESADQGKPVWLAEAMDVSRVVHNFRFFASAILHSTDEAMQTNQNCLTYVTRRPIGVAGLISPWNLPLYLLTWKIAPAIGFGNSVVCKPSEFTSHTAAMLCEVLQEAQLPWGVVNMVFGTGLGAGEPLVRHPNVPLISFTGGTATGREISQIAAPMFKRLSLELGGKNPAIILDDADFDRAVETTVNSSFLNQGEICLCGSRIYVQRGIYEAFVSKFTERVRKLEIGDPSKRETFIGPLVSRQHLLKVEGFMEVARKEGVEILCGGERPKLAGQLKNGYFFQPTVLTGVRHESPLQQEEIFGPVVTVTPFVSDEEAIGLANGVRYGLSATVWTKSLPRAHRIVERLDVGTVWINTWLKRDLRAPFGGMKASGIGREGQEGSREFFTETKTIVIEV